MGPVRVGIPPSPEYAGVIRLAIGSLARTAGLDAERTHDLKTAVSEACAGAILAATKDGSTEEITVSWTATEDAISVEVAGAGSSAPVSNGEGEDPAAFSAALLSALLDDYSVSDDGGRHVVRLTLRLS